MSNYPFIADEERKKHIQELRKKRSQLDNQRQKMSDEIYYYEDYQGNLLLEEKRKQREKYIGQTYRKNDMSLYFMITDFADDTDKMQVLIVTSEKIEKTELPLFKELFRNRVPHMKLTEKFREKKTGKIELDQYKKISSEEFSKYLTETLTRITNEINEVERR